MTRSNQPAFTVRVGRFDPLRILGRIVLLAISVGLALAGCRRDESTPPPVPVAFIALIGADQADHQRARQQLQDEWGARVQITAVDAPDAGIAARQLDELLAAGRARLVIATSAGLDEVMSRAAASADGVRFEQRAGYRRLPNLRNFDLRSHEAAYLAGVQAAMTTVARSIEVQLVAGWPVTPERVCEINGFALGVRSVDASIKVRVVAQDAPASSGPDLRLMLAPEGIVLSRLSDLTEIGRASLQWLPYYRRAVQDVLDGSWNNQPVWWGMRDGVVGWIESGDTDAAMREKLQTLRAALRDGRQPLWRGPLRDQSGQTLLRDGEAADDRFLRGMHVLIQGIDGTLPAMR
jgi:simple sugar transport system substrate-binding protein